MLSRIAIFFEIHDVNQSGYLSKDDIIVVSESFLFLFRKHKEHSGDESSDFLAAVSNFINLSYQMLVEKSAVQKRTQRLQSNDSTKQDAQETKEPQEETKKEETKQEETKEEETKQEEKKEEIQSEEKDIKKERQESDHKEEKMGQTTGGEELVLTLSAFRGVVLAVPFLEKFFDTGIPNSFYLTKEDLAELSLDREESSEFEELISSEVEAVSIPQNVNPNSTGIRKLFDNLLTSRKVSSSKSSVKSEDIEEWTHDDYLEEKVEKRSKKGKKNKELLMENMDALDFSEFNKAQENIDESSNTVTPQSEKGPEQEKPGKKIKEEEELFDLPENAEDVLKEMDQLLQKTSGEQEGENKDNKDEFDLPHKISKDPFDLELDDDALFDLDPGTEGLNLSDLDDNLDEFLREIENA